MKTSPKIASPLRYPGGKSKAVKIITPHFPQVTKMVSPFIGGGSIEIALANSGIEVIAYDALHPLVDFWQIALRTPVKLADLIEEKYYPSIRSKKAFLSLRNSTPSTKIERAARFFVLNRCSFSGTTESGGMSTLGFNDPKRFPRFTLSAIQRLRDFRCPNLTVKHADFHDSLVAHKEDFVYLDPPYYKEGLSLYGKRGDLHKGFDHEGLRDILLSRGNWILSYDNHDVVKKWYQDHKITFPTWKYGMGNSKDSKEILIVSSDLEDKEQTEGDPSMSGANSNLNKAKSAKQDEFYTQLVDIEKELKYYKEHFQGKVVYCNCDDPAESNFYTFFKLNFKDYGLKKLITTHYDDTKPTYKLELYLNAAGALTTKKTPLKQNGDFRSDECVAILDEADIIVTNPPFSLFREYIAQLMEYEKKFLFISNMNAVTYKDTFPLIMDNRLWYGPSIRSGDREFRVPASYTLRTAGIRTDEQGNRFIRVTGVRWFTNLHHKKRNEELTLFRNYYPAVYPKYDNYDAINVDKVADIPKDYYGAMGVPITFMDKYNPKQFEILGNTNGVPEKQSSAYLNGKKKYARIIIRRKKSEDAYKMEHGKKFLVVGNNNAITYKEIFKHIKEDKLWLGVNNGAKTYQIPSSYTHKNAETIDGKKYVKLGNTGWFTNLTHKKRNEELILYRKYTAADYPTYDNYDVINVNKIVDIPEDYDGPMGVPITFLDKHNPGQFEILGVANSARWIGYEVFTILNGKKIYNRIIIKRKKSEDAS